MAWSAEVTETQQTSIGTSWTTGGQTQTLNPGETAAGVIWVDNQSGTVTDSLDIRVLVSHDGSNWSQAPIMEFRYTPPNVNNEPGPPVTITGWPNFKMSYKSSGATNTYNAQLKYKKDGVNL
jgi:hypothetical protein